MAWWRAPGRYRRVAWLASLPGAARVAWLASLPEVARAADLARCSAFFQKSLLSATLRYWRRAAKRLPQGGRPRSGWAARSSWNRRCGEFDPNPFLAADRAVVDP